MTLIHYCVSPHLIFMTKVKCNIAIIQVVICKVFFYDMLFISATYDKLIVTIIMNILS